MASLCQTYTYLPSCSHRTLLPCDSYEIILLGNWGTCVWTTCLKAAFHDTDIDTVYGGPVGKWLTYSRAESPGRNWFWFVKNYQSFSTTTHYFGNRLRWFCIYVRDTDACRLIGFKFRAGGAKFWRPSLINYQATRLPFTNWLSSFSCCLNLRSMLIVEHWVKSTSAKSKGWTKQS